MDCRILWPLHARVGLRHGKDGPIYKYQTCNAKKKKTLRYQNYARKLNKSYNESLLKLLFKIIVLNTTFNIHFSINSRLDNTCFINLPIDSSKYPQKLTRNTDLDDVMGLILDTLV